MNKSIEIDQYEIKEETDMFIVRYDRRYVPGDTIRNLLASLTKIAKEKGFNRNQPVILATGDIKIEQLSEEEMNHHGWYRKKEGNNA